MRRAVVMMLMFALSAGGRLDAADPPPTPTRPVTETLHGIEITDPYRWLEGDADGTLTDEVAAWTDAQNAHTRDVLDALPGRAEVEARLTELMSIGSVRAPVTRGNRYFYSKRQGNQSQPVIYVREGHDGIDRVLLDPNTLDESGLEAVGWYEPNHQGTLLAFGTYLAGDENTTLYILDVETGDWLPDEIPGKVRVVTWMPDGSGFFYRRLADVEDPYSGRICFHHLGTHSRQDEVLFSQFTEGPGAKTWGPWAALSKDGHWLQVGYSYGWTRNDLWVVDVDHWKRTGEFVKHDVLIDEEATHDGVIHGDTLYLRTDLDAPTSRLIAIDLHDPSRDSWTDVIPAREDAVLQSVTLARGMLVATYLQNAYTRIERFKLDGTPLGELSLPGIGSASINTNRDRTEAFLTFESYNEPSSIYRVDLATGDRWLWARPDVPVDPSQIDVEQVWYSSKDGTKVSMFVISRKGLVRDGNNACELYGYGGFNISMTPRFSATLYPWLEAGGVYAVANLRGGGEYGEPWHRAGMLHKKQNVFDDCITAGEWLVENGYTNPGQLAVSGGSNGGLLVGAVTVQRPDLFRAGISAVPLLDMLRYQDFLMARYWVPEYGSAEEADQFEYIRAYSPYHNVQEGVEYPAMLYTAGENDTRVHPLHARKMAALMQAKTGSDPAEQPVLLWVDRDAGHGAGKPLHIRVRDVADRRMFLMWQLGMLDG